MLAGFCQGLCCSHGTLGTRGSHGGSLALVLGPRLGESSQGVAGPSIASASRHVDRHRFYN